MSYFVFGGTVSKYKPHGGLYSEGRFNEGFFALRVCATYIWRSLYVERLIFGILRCIDFVNNSAFASEYSRFPSLPVVRWGVTRGRHKAWRSSAAGNVDRAALLFHCQSCSCQLKFWPFVSCQLNFRLFVSCKLKWLLIQLIVNYETYLIVYFWSEIWLKSHIQWKVRKSMQPKAIKMALDATVS